MSKKPDILAALLAGRDTPKAREVAMPHTRLHPPRCCGEAMRLCWEGIVRDHWKCNRCGNVQSTELYDEHP